jgi:hypothetical protein
MAARTLANASTAGIFAFLVGLTVVYAFANDFVKSRTGLAA